MGTNPAASNQSGSFGSISYDGNRLTIEIAANSLGVIALTDGVGRIECFWDGTQWVCNSITFGATPSSS